MPNERDRQGTGQHRHNSTEEPWPHNEAAGRGEKTKSSAAGAKNQSGRSGSSGSDLKQREYKDKEGNVHHHTKTSQEQRGKK